MADSINLPIFDSGLLWAKANRIFRTKVSQTLEKYSLTMTEWALLGKLSESKENGVHLADIASTLSVEPPLVTTMVAGLEKKELLARKEDIRDRRAKFIYLTERGHNLVPEIESEMRQTMQKLFHGVSEEDILRYQEVLKTLVKNGSL